ncbi:MAG: 4-hydroxy-tetrahydrodipicolinate synthase [Ruminiclostridium sp.]|nr:4-hydroxy-tetrahydrodipicolinate synthase [Ruminiclostridium sp.]
MKNTIFTGAAVAIITPMNADGSINYDVFADIIEEQIAGGTDAIVVCGTTGEASTMTDEEHIEAIRFTVEKVAKRIPVIAGTGSNDTGYAIELSKQAEAVGADALLQVTPYYNKTSQRGLVAHFTAIADAVNIPIILYNVPSRTGMTISVDTYIELAKHPNIVATKEASGNFSLIAEIAAKTDLDIYSDNDDQVLGVLAFGGKGVISVSSNVIPREKHDMVMLFMNGEREKALELQNKYLDMENAMFIDVNPIPVKEAMNLMGKNVGECRLPLVKMEAAKIEKLRAELAKVGLV